MENTFGLIVQRERNRQGLSLAKLSSLLNNEIDPSYINRLEKEQKNPSFKVVCLLTSALNLDVREVFRSFGFAHLITNYDEDAMFSMEEFIRLHKLRHPSADRLINKEEQEVLIKIIHEVFEISQSKAWLDQLVPLLKEVQKLRDIHERGNTEIIEVQFLNNIFQVNIKVLLSEKKECNFDEVKKNIQDEIETKGAKLLDVQDGNFVINLNDEKWLAEKQFNRITFLTRIDEELIQV